MLILFNTTFRSHDNSAQQTNTTGNTSTTSATSGSTSTNPTNTSPFGLGKSLYLSCWKPSLTKKNTGFPNSFILSS